MSMGRKERIPCPRCQNSGSFVIWEIIDTVEEEKNMKEQVMSGEAFLFECPFCHNRLNVDYGFLYHQVEDHLMIQYARTEEAVQEGMESFQFMSGGNIPGFDLAEDYRFRIVRSQNQVREKILIGDSELDDHVIELMKIFMLTEMRQSTFGMRLKELLFDVDDNGNKCFVLTTEDGKGGTVEFVQEVYDSIAAQFSLEIEEDDCYIVDMAWAMATLEENQNDGLTS